MSIAIDTDLIYLQSRLHLSAEKLEQYKGKSVEEIVTNEAEAGNTQAIALANELLTNIELLKEIFQLADPNNKFAILYNMPAEDLQEFLPLMDEEDLNQGLYFFTKDKILNMLEKVPPEQLVKTVLEMFSQEEIIQYMPEEQLDKLLTNPTLDKNKVLEHLKSIPPEYLMQMLESVKGEELKDSQNANAGDLVKQVSQLNNLEYKDALTSLQPTQKQQLVLSLTKEDEKLYQLFDPHAYTKIIDPRKEKAEIVKAMNVLEKDVVVNMINELPKDLLSVVITQIDTDVFADNLMNKHPEIIAQLITA